MFDLTINIKKKKTQSDGNRLIIDFDKKEKEKTNNDIIIEEVKEKQEIVKPKIKKKKPRKGKSLI